VALHEFAGGDSVALLARTIGVSHSRAVRVVDRLEAEGWARRRTDPIDGRSVSVELTGAGRRVAKRALRARSAVLAEFLAPLGDGELRTLGRIAGSALGEQARADQQARHICRLCDARTCGHAEGRCPVTEARRARAAAG
jgi:DNA-binding MarR family transcriptional regulator